MHRATRRCADGTELQVSLKRLHPHLATTDEAVRMFVNEAQIASVLDHDNICRFYELGMLRDQFFISMEYIDGLVVRRILQDAHLASRPPPFAVTLSLLCQLCDALDYAHDRSDGHSGISLGLVHRDISPSNLIVTWDGRLKLIDLGIAKARTTTVETQTGFVRGKFGYMAPEVLRGQRADRRSDIYGVGVVAWELLTAERLFGPGADPASHERIRRGAVEPPSTHNAACAPQLDAVVMRALQPQPVRRWPTAASMRTALESVAAILHEPIGLEVVSQWLHAAHAVPEEVASEETDRTTVTLVRAPGSRAESGGVADAGPAPGISGCLVPGAPVSVSAPAVPRLATGSGQMTVTHGTNPHDVIAWLRRQLAEELDRRRGLTWGMGVSLLVNVALLALVFARPPDARARTQGEGDVPARATSERATKKALVGEGAASVPSSAKPAARRPSVARRVASKPATRKRARSKRVKRKRAPSRRATRKPTPSKRVAQVSTRRSPQEPADARDAVALSRPPRLRYARYPRSRSSRAAFVARVCIDDRGRVATVRVTKGPKRLHRRIRRYLRHWRYSPHRVRGSASAACFSVRDRIRQWR